MCTHYEHSPLFSVSKDDCRTGYKLLYIGKDGKLYLPFSHPKGEQKFANVQEANLNYRGDNFIAVDNHHKILRYRDILPSPPTHIFPSSLDVVNLFINQPSWDITDQGLFCLAKVHWWGDVIYGFNNCFPVPQLEVQNIDVECLLRPFIYSRNGQEGSCAQMLELIYNGYRMKGRMLHDTFSPSDVVEWIKRGYNHPACDGYFILFEESA